MTDETVPKFVRNKCNVMCCVPQCHTRSNKASKSILHKFPKDPDRRMAWIDKLKIEKKVSSHFVVCNKHFADSDYKDSKYLLYLYTYFSVT